MAAVCNRSGHYILPCSLFFIFLFSSPNLSRQRVDVYHISTRGVALVSANVECRCCTRPAGNTGRKKSPKICHLRAIVNFVGLYRRNWGTYRPSESNLLSSNISARCPHNMVNFGPLAAEIGPVVWGTPANFNGFRVLTALLHGSPVAGVSQTLQRWTESTTYVRQGDHHVGHWPTF